MFTDWPLYLNPFCDKPLAIGTIKRLVYWYLYIFTLSTYTAKVRPFKYNWTLHNIVSGRPWKSFGYLTHSSLIFQLKYNFTLLLQWVWYNCTWCCCSPDLNCFVSLTRLPSGLGSCNLNAWVMIHCTWAITYFKVQYYTLTITIPMVKVLFSNADHALCLAASTTLH